MFLFVVLKTQSVDVLMVLILVVPVMLVNSLLYLFLDCYGAPLVICVELEDVDCSFRNEPPEEWYVVLHECFEEEGCVDFGVYRGFLALQ